MNGNTTFKVHSPVEHETNRTDSNTVTLTFPYRTNWEASADMDDVRLSYPEASGCAVTLVGRVIIVKQTVTK